MEGYDIQDRHASARDGKLRARHAQRAMRGNRSVFLIAEERRKRDKRTLRDHRRSQ